MGDEDDDFFDQRGDYTPEAWVKKQKRKQERERRKRRLLDDPAYKARQAALRNSKRYLMQREDYNTLKLGPCEVCSTTESGNVSETFSMDHCHTCGQFRGPTCNSCNSAIAGLDYLIENNLLNEAVEYVMKHRKEHKV